MKKSKSENKKPLKFVQYVSGNPVEFVIELLRGHLLLSRSMRPEIFSTIEQLQKGKHEFSEVHFRRTGAQMENE